MVAMMIHHLSQESTALAPVRRTSVRDLIERQAIVTVLEPIVDTTTYRFHGHEALGRGALAGLPTGSAALFELAEEEGLAVQLGELMRERAVRVVGESFALRLFLGSHPAEYVNLPRLVASLARLRERSPDLLPVLEIPQKANTTLQQLRWLRDELSYLAVEVCYEGLGPGLSLLGALVEVPPDYVKVDERLIVRAYPSNGELLLTGIVDIARQLGIRVVAQGLVQLDEVVSSRRLGCELCQGPAPLVFPTAERLLPGLPGVEGGEPTLRVLGSAGAEALNVAARRLGAAVSTA
jgi:EAL domain-containing protein (putative c-di-GMP-specific phosphodiesterase class I)